MARICIDARMIHNSGIGVYIRNYIYYLLSIKSFELILLGRKEELNLYFSQFNNWQHIEANFPIYSIKEQVRLPLLIPKCDIFWSPHYNIPLLPIRARKRLVTVPDVFHLAHLETLSFSQKIYALLVTNAAVMLSDRVITISQFSIREIVRLTKVNPAKVRAIPLGLDTTLFHQVDNEQLRQHVRNKYGLPKQYILFVGNVKPNKNLRMLVEAFALLALELPECHLLIAGKKDGFVTGDKALFTRISTDSMLSQRVYFSGFVDLADLPVLYSMAAVFGFPSLYEGFGFPPLEAMACGCPVVASNKGSIPEVCGNAAHYVNPIVVEDIARGLKEVMANSSLRQKLITAGLNHIQLYNWAESRQQFVQEINDLL